MPNVLRLEELPGSIAILTWDEPGKKVNTMSEPVLTELSALVDQLEQRSDLRGLLLRSGKPGQFIAGADLHELARLPELRPEEARAKLEEGHLLFDRVSRLPFPTVALIDGPCMGGGTELSLCFDERIASNNPKTRIGLPEVTIGLIPGWGGTQRMPRLIGLPNAIEMICSGEPLTSQRATELGLVFDAVPAERLVEEGQRVIDLLIAGDAWKTRRAQRSQPLGLSEDQLRFTVACAEGQIKLKAKGQPTSSLVALKAMQQGANRPLDEALEIERTVALEVIGSPVSANLIGVFFMSTALGRDRGVSDPNVQSRPVNRVGVLGAGLMGAGIATAHARSGVSAAMVDVSEERLADGMSRARKVVESRIEIGRAKPADMVELLSRLNTSTSVRAFDGCDVVIEAVTENESLKKQTYGQLAPSLRDDAILASNTSTISITRLAQAAPHPERFAGMHFFYPVDRMQLVEVIRGEKTSDETVVTLVELARRLRKTPIVCRDCPGFLVNRILLPYMNESIVLLLEGATMDQLDAVATRFGFPMGPIALHDLVGLDTAYYAGEVMLAAFRDRTVETRLLGQLVKAGRLGKKSGAGFRKFVGKKGTPADDPDALAIVNRCRISDRKIDDAEIQDRLLLSMLLEATRILEEQIVASPMHVDMGLILGIGFPPFRGGLLKWCDNEGAKNILDRLAKYTPLGKRFEPTTPLTELARSGGKFHGRAT
jgi:3-hydroxyacyl-CoA dehydrogenase/enoyl-CoA hydratase/3-hydroxybutyryl-CoA epimerase/3-hydroxyacyl-CoA dehydrogenase/enoyl-CoA hydratase/3-hydroxybutyryl-CoA epimerase/enoyl-CoA isomerase